MGKILSAYLFPHPPIIIKEIGRGDETGAKATVEGCEQLARDIKDKRPDTIIVITSHGPLFKDAISISVNERLEGNFGNFGQSKLKFEYKNNLELVDKIIAKSNSRNIPIVKVDEDLAMDFNIDLKLDHGTLVPLYFVDKEYEGYKIVHITYGLLTAEELYDFGRIIQESVLESDENISFIASGDLSHKLSNRGPYSYSPHGEKFDREIVRILKEGDLKSLVSFDLDLSEKAGECGLRSLMILAGFLDEYNIDSEVISYEGPFGVGYCNAKLSILDNEGGTADTRIEDEYVKLARNSLEYYVKHNKRMEVPSNLAKELLNSRHGAFVSLKKDGILRGCIGTIEPIQENLALEIIENAISAGLRDPRFGPVSEEELSQLVYSVDVLKEPEPIDSMEELDVKRYGIIVSKGFRKGLLLPNLEGVDTPEEQLGIALSKAGISPDEDYRMERFEVIRHS